ncbi:MAG: peptidyl-prolyl cis-trans isomerase [Candidatus Gastranaerophilales bacterium]|nr:peptidyl-prolyl cis-trans isomerase [Candidatus Gastranaerophilales bacterium]
MKNVFKLFLLLFLGAFCFLSSLNNSDYSKAIAFQTNCSQVKASHILVDSKEQAEIIKQKLDEGANFQLLAKEYSKCPSGTSGGDLGYFSRGQMVKEFENAAFNMNIGEVSKPVKTQYGWHIIKVYNKI